MEHGTKMEQYAKNMYKYRMYARNYMIAICPYTQHWNLGRKIRLIPTLRIHKRYTNVKKQFLQYKHQANGNHIKKVILYVNLTTNHLISLTFSTL